jgi:guanylate kinase
MNAKGSNNKARESDITQNSPDEDHRNGQGRLFVVSAPSGAGKTTLCKAALARIPDLRYSVSYTTRRPRSGEQNGVAYHFIGREEFVRGIDTRRWAEWAKVHGHYYGTSAEFISLELSSGHDILLDIDVQGAMQIRKRFVECVTVFVMPPSRQVLEERLRSRGSDSREEIERRMKNAEKEMAGRHLYQHVLVNDRLDVAIKELVALIESYRREPAKRRR